MPIDGFVDQAAASLLSCGERGSRLFARVRRIPNLTKSSASPAHLYSWHDQFGVEIKFSSVPELSAIKRRSPCTRRDYWSDGRAPEHLAVGARMKRPVRPVGIASLPPSVDKFHGLGHALSVGRWLSDVLTAFNSITPFHSFSPISTTTIRERNERLGLLGLSEGDNGGFAWSVAHMQTRMRPGLADSHRKRNAREIAAVAVPSPYGSGT